MAASLQPIIHLWKSEILQLSEYLNVPQLAINKSCETDCICGRLSLPARHIKEVDMLLMSRCGELSKNFELLPSLRVQLDKFIDEQIHNNKFKKSIPYTPDPLIFEFESGFVNVKKFNHFGHMYVAFYYLKDYGFDKAVERYLKYLKPILDTNGQSHRFNPILTKAYFDHLDKIMKEFPAYDNFYEMAECIPKVLDKVSA
jgi:hypothetical protein